VGLFPLLMRVLPADSPQLAALLAQLRSPQQLWTPHGLRSLSASAALYNQSNTQHDAPYWRAPIWLNINYLALAALRHYSQARRPGVFFKFMHARLHAAVRVCVPAGARGAAAAGAGGP
jgi:mannosyl-oligosaccharide glucosidase